MEQEICIPHIITCGESRTKRAERLKQAQNPQGTMIKPLPISMLLHRGHVSQFPSDKLDVAAAIRAPSQPPVLEIFVHAEDP